MSDKTNLTCSIDRDILNEKTVGQMADIGLAFFAKLCGANRGAFVLDPPDGKTYGCTSFPESFSINAGLDAPIPDSANLTQTFAKGDITAAATVDILDQYVSAVYASSSGVDSNPYACDVSGLATLGKCESATGTAKSLRPDGDVVKAVTLAGAFVPQPSITGGQVLSMDEVKDFYKSKDFRQMADLGVNTVQIPVPCDTFYENGVMANTVSRLLAKADTAGLSAILVLVAPDMENDDMTDELIHKHVHSAAIFASGSSTVIALQLPSPSPSLLTAVRSESAELSVLVPTDTDKIENLSFPPDSYTFAALDVAAITSVADAASSDSQADRTKMFYHESITCITRSPIEWSDCYRDMPVYVTSGFDLAIDDCVNQDEEDFKDYGQCDRFDETIVSGWWDRHRLSLASRQVVTYSTGLGWSFSSWKLYGEETDGVKNGVINTPAKLMCLRDVAAAGLMPSLLSTSNSSDVSAACLNGPLTDFVLGDDTYAPTPAPHDCGEGWWNDITLQCDYWIPPPPAPTPTDYPALVKGAIGGAVVALALSWVVKKMSGRNEGYQVLP
mmetsp:Transcript_14190/g.30833  ORF Transcript_14190/g.30833 Transcript_14190/m.30833 type:complete len:558 (-) Transcript_14190:136-1809(-)|eukprot:CAMPEP_0172298928 /NCGR_PEP_ID=MMETSP1058-20130122/1350_1 /TAXON_ID=83371 /ORGANISM="Detonula confervacea, Strain CCMP 353" /LENGTH=557 /DNA_ID=CAMNT_0013008223 /DNA_START=30 /DNA_END=1703 /DNA_ORIENTATION=+